MCIAGALKVVVAIAGARFFMGLALAQGVCNAGMVPYAVEDDCPALMTTETCVNATGDLLINYGGWRRLADNLSIDKIAGTTKFELRYVVNRLNLKASEEALYVIVSKDYDSDAYRAGQVMLSRNEDDLTFTDSSIDKPDYNNFHEGKFQGGATLDSWHTLPNLFVTRNPASRRRIFMLSSSDLSDDDRLPHARIYTFSSNKLSCIPFYFDWQEGVDSVDLVAIELAVAARERDVVRRLRLMEK